MLRYMLDTNICIYVIKNRPEGLRERFNRLADQLCKSDGGDVVVNTVKRAINAPHMGISRKDIPI